MQLPRELQHFPDGALLVASDTTNANFFLLGGDNLEELDGIALPKEIGKDGEGSFEFFPDDAERLKTFGRRVATQIDALVRERHISTVHLVMPAEVEHLVSATLPGDVAPKIGKRVHADLMNMDALEPVRRIVAQLGLA